MEKILSAKLSEDTESDEVDLEKRSYNYGRDYASVCGCFKNKKEIAEAIDYFTGKVNGKRGLSSPPILIDTYRFNLGFRSIAEFKLNNKMECLDKREGKKNMNKNYNNKFNLLFLICILNLFFSIGNTSYVIKLSRLFELPRFGEDYPPDLIAGGILISVAVLLIGKLLFDFIKILIKGEK